jgi:DNA-binding NarL/FixJ family response regulator
MNGTQMTQLEPQIRLQAEMISELAGRVQSVLTETRALRLRSAERRRRVEEESCLRRSSRDASSGPTMWHGRMPASEPTSPAEPPMMSLLTRRMRQILELLVQGKSEKEVASELGVSPHTVHIHVTRMYSRLGVNSRAELLARFYRQGPARNHN